ncbi:hypothetical protein [Mycoplasmopsis columbinasalis]|uniref:Uncharacterized protein n=1 Tax=Mycoplasmopsis columbinasalis TaxID=114880 RepID=A0A449BB08_9BACT|nr:hypothetical protein [Mycoplasmopsis columbinasalis]VEU78386.1 Uncharacterised protein [Mycoplasmopsis columbinasalis]
MDFSNINFSDIKFSDIKISDFSYAKARAALEPLRQLNNEEYNWFRHKIITIEYANWRRFADTTDAVAKRNLLIYHLRNSEKNELLLIEEINEVIAREQRKLARAQRKLAREQREAAKNNNKEAANV